jgi:hypothetical protein
MVDPTIPLECPFCEFAGDAVIRPCVEYEYYLVECFHCHARGPKAQSTIEAIRLWNQAPRRRLLGR